MDNDVAIKIDNVSKTFILPHEKNTSIKGAVVNFYKNKKSYEKQDVLKDVSFEVKKGEFFGIVGRNGSGKSTLLKTIAGIYAPNKGAVMVNGSLTPFIELGVGFNQDLSGRENVFLNGALLGFTRAEMYEMYDDIVKFAELERFMDQKLKNYSSGMQVRLAFSIAIRANTDILILDEVLAVGDAAFQQKCTDYFKEVKKSGKTIILVTHDMVSVEKYCTRALLLEKGIVKEVGNPTEIANQYTIDNFETSKEDKPTSKHLTSSVKSLEVKVLSKQNLTTEEYFEFEVTYELNKKLPIYLAFSLMFNDISLAEHNSTSIELKNTTGKEHKVRYKLPLSGFNKTSLKLNVSIFNATNQQPLGYKTDVGTVFIDSKSKTTGGPMFIDGVWSQG